MFWTYLCTWKITSIGNLGAVSGDRDPAVCKDNRTNEDKGCLDINALNYNVCCNGDPACTVVGPNPECCEYEHEPDHKGCMDSTALNYMTLL